MNEEEMRTLRKVNERELQKIIAQQDEKDREATIRGLESIDRIQYHQFLKERKKTGGKTDWESFKNWQFKRDFQATVEAFNSSNTPPEEKEAPSGGGAIAIIVICFIIFASLILFAFL